MKYISVKFISYTVRFMDLDTQLVNDTFKRTVIIPEHTGNLIEFTLLVPKCTDSVP